MAAIELVRTYDARHPQGTPDSESGSAEGGGPTAGSGPGHTFLIDRLWPRGIAKTELTFDSWITDIAPSTELRKWFDHDPAKFDEFRARYRSELDANPGPASPNSRRHRQSAGATAVLGQRHRTQSGCGAQGVAA